MKSLFSNKSDFEKICQSNKFSLDYLTNKDYLFLLKAIFEEREYADYFPFYENAWIVDVGAHVGYFSLFASLNSGPESRIISVEPDERNYHTLQRNVIDAKRKNIEALHIALSDHSGDVTLFQGNSVNHSLISDYALNEGRHSHTIVKSLTLAELMKRTSMDHIDFLKLDCEGAEYAIILHTPDDILKKIRVISMEFHDLKDARYTANVLHTRLKKLGFTIEKFQYERTEMGLNFGKLIAVNYV